MALDHVPLLAPPGSPRRSPRSPHASSSTKGLKRLAPAAIFLTAFIVSAVDNLRLRSGSYSRGSITGRSEAHHGQPTPRVYSILPRKIYSVIGLESSGTQFVSKIIEDALKTNSEYRYRGPYREGSAPCIETCTDGSDECLVRKSIVKGHECFESNDVQVQHYSLPWGGSCQEHPNPPVVDVVLPPQCSRNQTSQIEKTECSAMANEIWGFQLNGRALIYPTRYQLDIVKSKEWYASQGVEQVFVIVVRDDKISFTARSSMHCNITELRQQEEDVGMQIIVDAINRYILKNADGESLSPKTLPHWVAKQYQGDGGMRRRLSAIPSDDGVVVVSYESLVKLGSTYVRMMYQALGIDSDFMPDNIKDSNAKYLRPTKEKPLSSEKERRNEYLPDGRWLFANNTRGAFDVRHGVIRDAGHLRHELVKTKSVGIIESCSMKEDIPRSKHVSLSSAASIHWEEVSKPGWRLQNERFTGNSTLDRITLEVDGKAFVVDEMGAEDPRVVSWRGQPLVIYHSVLRGRQMWLYDHRTSTRTQLTICGHGTQGVEKNWSPLVVSASEGGAADDDLFILLVYNIDPLVILRYDVEGAGDGVCTLVYGNLPLASMPSGRGPYGGTPFKKVPSIHDSAPGQPTAARSYISLAHSREDGNNMISPERQLGGAVYRPVPVVLHVFCLADGDGMKSLKGCTFGVDRYEPWLEVQSPQEVFDSPWRRKRQAGAVNGSVSYPYDLHVFTDGLVRVGVEYEDCVSVYEDYRINFGSMQKAKGAAGDAQRMHQTTKASKCPASYANRSQVVVSIMEKGEAVAKEVEGEIWVVSHGGVSSERLRGHIDRIEEARGVPPNPHTNPTSGEKHRLMQGVLAHFPYPLPSNRPLKGPRLCIYVFGSVYESVMSQLRRHPDNPAKLHNDESYPEFSTLEELLEHPDPDPFGILNQFENFLAANVTYPVLLVKYDALSDLTALQRLDEAVAELTGHNYNFTALRSEGYVRTSTLDSVPDPVRDRFVERYSPIKELFDSQPLIRVLTPPKAVN